MAAQGVTADIIETDERVSCCCRHPHPLETWHTSSRRGYGSCSTQRCTADAEVGR
jgi:hypothetical protein